MNGTLRRLRLLAALTGIIAALVGSLAHAQSLPRMEVGTVSDVNQNFQTHMFDRAYNTAPLVFTLLPGTNDTDPSILRIKNVSTTGFDIAQLETNNLQGNAGAMDGMTTPRTVTYFAIEPGNSAMNGTIGGLQWEAGTVATTENFHGDDGAFGGSEGFEPVSFGSPFGSAPAVLTFVQTMTNSDIETMSTAMPDSDPMAGGFDVALDLAEDSSGGTNGIPTVDETIGYFAIEQGVATFTTEDGTTVTLDAFDSSALNIGGLNAQEGGTGEQISFNADFDGEIPFAVASKTSSNGGDGGWIRQASIDATDIFLFLQEDQFNDSELAHGSQEAATILAFSSLFNTAPIPEPTTIAIWSLLGVIGAGFGWVRYRKKNR